jgi:GH35 family endo-1,4-beta-xylanase
MRNTFSIFYHGVFFSLFITLLLFSFSVRAQSYATWYKNAQERIDTLRKGIFGMQIFDQYGQPYTGKVTVKMKKHEFPFGIAFDFYEGAGSMGNSYSTSSTIKADADMEIYRTERWSSYLAYAIPVTIGKEYKLTLKFAEIYASSSNSRLFDVKVENDLFLNDLDVFAKAGGKNIAWDTTLVVMACDDALNIELFAVRDNAMIKGIVVEETGGSAPIRINCGGTALTTANGNQYVAEAGFFDPDINTIASREQWMQAAMYKYFNYGVSGNTFKWSGIQPRYTKPDYTNFENAVRWTKKVGWDLRAHTLLWGGNDAHSMPDWVRALPTPKAITDTCKMRVQREVLRYKGIIKEYDVINEPLTGHADWLRKTVGDSIIWNCFKWAREVDPDAELFINDYNVEYNWGQAIEYRNLIKKVKEMGAPVTGVGLQAHFWDCCRPNVDELVKNMNIIAEAGLPMRLTEYDWGTNLTQKQQVDDFIKVLTVAFSHPSVTGMICWGLGDEGAWRPNTGFFDTNYKPKLAADTLLYYTKTKWATNFESTMQAGNPIQFSAYYGDYSVEVDFNGTIKTFTVPCLKKNMDSLFILNEANAVLKGPGLLSVGIISQNSVRLLFDKPIQSSSIKRSNFKLFSKREIGLNAVAIDPANGNALILSLSKNIPLGDYVSVSYFPGSLKASDGSVAQAFGPEGIINAPKTSVFQQFGEYSVKVYPNPATKQVHIECPDGPHQVTVFNSVGAHLLTESFDMGSSTIDVSGFPRGMCLIRIKSSEGVTSHQKIVLK